MLAVVVVVSLVRPMAAFSAPRAAPNPAGVEMAYERLGRWFADNTPESASFGYMEIGIAGFYSHRTVIDALGLVNPDVAQHVAQRDLLWAFRKHRPDYIVVFEAVPLEPWFAAEYQYPDVARQRSCQQAHDLSANEHHGPRRVESG